mgnify:CR=1 FL=1
MREEFLNKLVQVARASTPCNSILIYARDNQTYETDINLDETDTNERIRKHRALQVQQESDSNNSTICIHTLLNCEISRTNFLFLRDKKLYPRT